MQVNELAEELIRRAQREGQVEDTSEQMDVGGGVTGSGRKGLPSWNYHAGRVFMTLTGSFCPHGPVP
jgi:hypothetical protein